MSDWRKFDCLFLGATPKSLINEIEPEPVGPLSALDRARFRWLCEPELIVGGLHEWTGSRR